MNDINESHISEPVAEGVDKSKTHRMLPIFSGMLIPFSIILSIPSLVGHWYIRTENNVATDFLPNPILLVVAIWFSMACVVLANVFLVVRFAERGVKPMTVFSIALLSFHGAHTYVYLSVESALFFSFQILLISLLSRFSEVFTDLMTASCMASLSGSSSVQL